MVPQAPLGLMHIAGGVCIHLFLTPPLICVANLLWLLGKQLATTFVDPEALTPLLNNRLIALDKNPGVCPIGIGEVSRRLIAKSILRVAKSDVFELIAAVCRSAKWI